MQEKRNIIMLGLILCLLGILSACGNGGPLRLSGTYSASAYGTTMSYTFKGDAVAVQYVMVGQEVARYEGTYAINDVGTQITLSFDAAQMQNAHLPDGLTTLGGTFSFVYGDGYIEIGTVRYERSDGNGPADPPQGTATDAPSESAAPPLHEVHLSLPEEYEIRYKVTETAGASRTYEQTMLKTADGFYFNFGDTGEQYVFVAQADGSYTQYTYDALHGTFVPSGAPASAGLVDGYAARMTSYFDFYETYQGNMTYQGQESIGNWECQKYTFAFSALTGTQTVTVWIEPEIGLCVKAVYQYDASVGVSGTKTAECVKFAAEGVALPAYE